MKIIPLLCLALPLVAVASGPRYDFSKIQLEKLGRGVVAVRENPDTVAVSWRYKTDDSQGEAFDVYRNGKKLNKKPISKQTFFKDAYSDTIAAEYTIKSVRSGDEASYTLPANAPEGYLSIPLSAPEEQIMPDGQKCRYIPNDASIGDVDGDGEYEIILKWDPTNARDNAHNGYTGTVFLDCYRLNGERLWRVDLGRNIRAGAHYTQFMVYDFDGDGKAEMICRTADGSVDAKGNVIGDPEADYREPTGRILRGKEYLTVFNGLTGEAMKSVDYIPQRGDPSGWGDEKANRSDRFLACVAYLDGVHPSVVMCRGYYTRSVLAAFDWDGKELTSRWVFDTDNPGCGGYARQGNHNLRVADVDGDGCDEIVYGQMAVDHDGKGLYTTGMYHGDAMHLTMFDPTKWEFQVWGCHENGIDGTTFRDAATGEVLQRYPSDSDIGRCMAADIDPRHPGVEMWSPSSGGIRNIKGELISPERNKSDEFVKAVNHGNRPPREGQGRRGSQGRRQFLQNRGVPVNMAVWWDGDLLRELLDHNRVYKYDWETGRCNVIKTFEGCMSNNGTKGNPCLQGDIVGDWREEVLLRSADNSELRLYVSPIPTDYRFRTFLEDPVYRISIATQNTAYNQPTQPGFYFGPDLAGKEFRGTSVK